MEKFFFYLSYSFISLGMGTNFYAKRIITEDDIQKLHKLIDEKRFKSDWYHEDDIYDSAFNLISYITSDGIHLGKRSRGWQFGFDHNWGKYYQPNRKSLEEFLNSPDIEIYDEYGDKYTAEEFWKEVEEHNALPFNSWVSKTYGEWERKEHPEWPQHDYCSEDRRKCVEMFGVIPEDCDFQVDGLRFSVFSDFC